MILSANPLGLIAMPYDFTSNLHPTASLEARDPQTELPDPSLMAHHLDANGDRFAGLIPGLKLTPAVASILAHFSQSDLGWPPWHSLALHITGTVWRTLVPTWDDRIAGRRERARWVRYEAEVLDQRVDALKAFDKLLARYSDAVRIAGGEPSLALAQVAAAEVADSLAMSWTEKPDGSCAITNIPDLVMAVEATPYCWRWWTLYTKKPNGSGVSLNLLEAQNLAIEVVTGFRPAGARGPVARYGML